MIGFRSALPIFAAVARLLWPLPENRGITSSFGEARGNHLHAGIDLSTAGENGLPVRAAADGEIVRLKVEWRGLGNAVYIRHAGGDESIYGHLQRFENDVLHLTDLVHRVQTENAARYPGNIEVAPPIRVRRGQLIAFSGESGSGFSHLHFEWREKNGTEPVDALARLPALPAPPRATIEDVFLSSDGRLRVAAHARSGDHEIGLATLTVRVDGRPYYSMNLSRLNFQNYLLAGGLYDLDLSERRGVPVYSLDPVGETFWPGQIAAEEMAPPGPGTHRVSVVVAAPGGKKTRWEGRIVGRDANVPPTSRENRLRLESDEGTFRLDLPAGSLHPAAAVSLEHVEMLRVRIQSADETPRPGAAIHYRPSSAAAAALDIDRTGFYRIVENRAPERAESRVVDTEIVASISRYGTYALIEDRTPPVLGQLRRDRCFYGPCWKIEVSDDLSGLDEDSVTFILPDGRRMLGEVDPDRGTAEIPELPGVNFDLVRVEARDRAGNRAALR